MDEITPPNSWESSGIRVVWPDSPWDGKVVSIRVTNGEVAQLAESKTEENPSCVLYPGLMDLFADFGIPGNEHRENPANAVVAARRGGFTRVVLASDGLPFPDEGATVAALRHMTANLGIHVHLAGGISQKGEGKELAELYDMHREGALAFIEPYQHFLSSSLLLKALLYSRSFGGIVVNQPGDASLSLAGTVHEGPVSVSLGLKGTPAIAEELGIERDVRLAQYANSPLLLHKISSRKGVEALRRAKSQYQGIYATVSLNQLLFTDEQLAGFDSHYKVWPPLREEDDRQALIEALKEGLIDAIVSDHKPFDPEAKEVEFDYAKFGIAGLQTFLPAWHQYLTNQLPESVFIRAAAFGPRRLMGLPVPVLQEGKALEAIVFDGAKTWTLNDETNASLARNSPFWGKAFTGSVVYHWNKQ